MKKNCLLILLLLILTPTLPARERGKTDEGFVTTLGTRFYCNGKPAYHVGTNMWYAAILASKGTGGDRKRLRRELDELHGMGADVLRVRIHFGRVDADSLSTTLPALWTENGTPNDTLLAGLDYLMAELGKRKMKAVVCLSATDTWSGGPLSFLPQTARPDPDTFYTHPEATERYMAHVRHIVGRTNRYTHRAYKDDATLMAWEICDRIHSGTDPEKTEAFVRFVSQAARTIKHADGNHLVAVGSDGLRGCNDNELLYQQIHNDPLIDYATLQLWPLEWDWVDRSRVAEDLPHVFIKATEYVEQHLRMAEGMDKPLVIDAFSYPRDRYFFSPSQSTHCRNDFFAFVMAQITNSAKEKGALGGCYLWTWGGRGHSTTLKWEAGNYAGDAPDRPQGLYAVFSSDQPTLQLIQKTTEEIRGSLQD